MLTQQAYEPQTANPRGNTYYVMRHGEAEQNVLGIVYGKSDDNFALTAAGKEQVKASAEKLSGITKIFASPVRRARESAKIAADVLGIPRADIVHDALLREFNFGTFSGKSVVEFSTYRNENIHALSDAFPEGESYLDAKRRFGVWLYDIDTKLSNERVLIVTHGIGVESLTSAAKGMSSADTLMYVRNHTFNYAHLADLEFVPLTVNDDFERITT